VEEVENKEAEPFSYSWRLMRLAAIKLAKAELKRMASIAGIEMSGKNKKGEFPSFLLNINSRIKLSFSSVQTDLRMH